MRSLSTADVSPLRHYCESRGSFSKLDQNGVVEKRGDERICEANDEETLLVDIMKNELTVVSNEFSKIKLARKCRRAQRSTAKERHSENEDTHFRSRSLDSKLPHHVNADGTGKKKSSSSIDILENLVKRSIKQQKFVPKEKKMVASMNKSKSQDFSFEPFTDAGENEEKPQMAFSESMEEIPDRIPNVAQWGGDLPAVQTVGRRRHKSADMALDSNENVTTPKGLIDVINRVHSSQGLDCVLQKGDGINPCIVMERRVSSGSLPSMGRVNEKQVVTPTEPIPIPRPQLLKVSPVREMFEEGDEFNEKTRSEQKLYAEKIAEKLNEFILKEQTHGDMSPRSSRDMEMLQLKYTEVMKHLKERQQLEPVYREAGRTDGPSSLEKEIAAWFVEKCATDDLSKVISPNVVLDLLGNLNYSQFQQAAQQTTDRADGKEYKLPLLFGLTRFGIMLVGYGTNAAQRLKDYCTQYVEDKLGWEHF